MLLSTLAALGALVGGAAVTPSRAAPVAVVATPSPPLIMVEHALPLAAAHRYEALLHEAMADQGSVLRWYIARVDEASGKAIAECVLRRHDAVNESIRRRAVTMTLR